MKLQKRIGALTLSLVMAVGLYFPAGAAVEDTGFADVAANAWYAQDVQYCRDNGLMNGTGETVFSPDETMSRAMLATVLYRMAGSPPVTGSDAFSDTDAGQWYSDAVLWAAQRDIVGGYDDGRFGTDDPVLREQIATILWRYAGQPAAGDITDFADEAAISPWAADAVDWARASGYINGDEANRFQPVAQATRAEVCAILARYDRAVQGSTQPEPEPQLSGTLVAYFSATGNTERIAQQLQSILNADLYEITPQVPYTSADLDYSNENCRANLEQNDPDARPAIAGSAVNMENYDTVFLGYPIWWGQAPKILSTFLESYELDGVTLMPFCTSGSSGIGSSDDNLHALAPNANWMDGERFNSSVTADMLAAWVDSLDLPAATTPETGVAETRVHLAFDGGEAVLVLEDNATVRDFVATLPATLTFEDYASTEKISYLDETLSTAGAPGSYDPSIGDVTLYVPWGNLAIFYGDIGSASGLIPMGRVESGLTQLAEMDGSFTVSAALLSVAS